MDIYRTRTFRVHLPNKAQARRATATRSPSRPLGWYQWCIESVSAGTRRTVRLRSMPPPLDQAIWIRRTFRRDIYVSGACDRHLRSPLSDPRYMRGERRGSFACLRAAAAAFASLERSHRSAHPPEAVGPSHRQRTRLRATGVHEGRRDTPVAAASTLGSGATDQTVRGV
jgi:hypothetical protein